LNLIKYINIIQEFHLNQMCDFNNHLEYKNAYADFYDKIPKIKEGTTFEECIELCNDNDKKELKKQLKRIIKYQSENNITTAKMHT
jgi:hypothetical protein